LQQSLSPLQAARLPRQEQVPPLQDLLQQSESAPHGSPTGAHWQVPPKRMPLLHAPYLQSPLPLHGPPTGLCWQVARLQTPVQQSPLPVQAFPDPVQAQAAANPMRPLHTPEQQSLAALQPRLRNRQQPPSTHA
jgi:hypothetical protein